MKKFDQFLVLVKTIESTYLADQKLGRLLDVDVLLGGGVEPSAEVVIAGKLV